MNIERAKQVCLDELLTLHVREDNWRTELYHKDVEDHYNDLREALENPTHKDLKILIFHPISIGDNIISSLAPELFQIKYPGCQVDYFTESPESVPILESNPFINKVIIDKNWCKFRTRDTRGEIPNGKPTEDGELLKTYDMGYSVYWWNSPEIESFLEDFDLPTDYTRLRIYPTEASMQKAKIALKDTNKLRICVQIEQSKWNKSFENYYKLLNELEEFGYMIPIGKTPGFTYADDAAIISQADLMICSSGSIEHVAAAVGCQTVTLSPVYDPRENCAAYYQNNYLPENRKHVIIRPSDWCGNYRCVIKSPNDIIQKEPRYGFNSEGKFPHIHTKPCDYKDFKKTCIHEITVDEIISKVKEVIKKRNE